MKKKKRQRPPKQRAAVGVLGKSLTRRSRGACELCESKDQPMAYELAPFPLEPELDRALMACSRCRGWLDGGDVRPIEAHFLSSAVWSEEPAVRLAAARLLLAVDDLEDPWLQDALASADVDPDTLEFRGPAEEAHAS